MLGSHLLKHHLCLFLAVELDLEHKIPGTELPVVGLRVCMSPAEVMPFLRASELGEDPLKLRDADGGTPWAILYIRDAYQQDVRILDPKTKRLLEDAKADALSKGIHHRVHTVLLHFTSDGVQSIFLAVDIPVEYAELAKEAEPFHLKSLIRGNFDLPFTKENILECAHTIIVICVVVDSF
jgi:hypothetical protein